ncbi:hypothetical protein MK805_07730 [Shimazuella sp. AN120528]|uniref:hypothetical protein n=1 Tax=Shimazuella soli TaxID=1892854 RepID=UPI001F0F3664|nr:hypothetical protein [Shimazuella soli]MCH5584863.1 hypothetical protein [Shimazuella soli]
MGIVESAQFSGEGNPLTVSYGGFSLSIWTEEEGYNPSNDVVKVHQIKRILIKKEEEIILDTSSISDEVEISFFTVEGTDNFWVEKGRFSRPFFYEWLDSEAETLVAFAK